MTGIRQGRAAHTDDHDERDVAASASCRLPRSHPASRSFDPILPDHDARALGTGRTTVFAISAGPGPELSADEVRRVERALIGHVAESGTLPKLRELATRSGVSRLRLRRSIGSVDDATSRLIDERFAIARACNDMSTGWHPSISVLAGRLVTHRLFVYRVLADVLPLVYSCPNRSVDVAELERIFSDELSYQVGRLGVFDTELQPHFVDETRELLALERIRSLDDGDRVALERGLNNDLTVVLRRFGAFERWNERRHDWFAPLDHTPPTGLPTPASPSVAAAS